MPKRKTVTLNLDFVLSKIKTTFRSNIVFCEKLEKKQYWVTDWKRGKNLPSPEEAAQMCLLLNTTPEEILLGAGETEEDTAELQADIALVRGLIEQEREKQGIKKDPTQTGEVGKVELLRSLEETDDTKTLLDALDIINRKLQERK